MTETTTISDTAASTFFSCDLVEGARQHLRFLQHLHMAGVTLQAVTPVQLHRYLHQWLPLLVTAVNTTAGQLPKNNSNNNNNNNNQTKTNNDNNVSQTMIPPPDVAWLWHCHRLAPAKYESYMQQRFGQVLSANPPFVFQQQEVDQEGDIDSATTLMKGFSREQAAATRCAWEEAYPTTPFFLETGGDDNDDDGGDDKTSSASHHCKNDTPCSSSSSSSSSSSHATYYCNNDTQQELHGFDLVASGAVQANFLWQVSGPRFLNDNNDNDNDNDSFLHQAVDKYYKFLSLVVPDNEDSHKSHLPLVPTYQIDLMWHTHILFSPDVYQKDCMRIRGAPFHHDDSLNDRTPGATLDQAFHKTCELWEQTYGEPYPVAGGMYRGEPPSVYFDTNVWTPQLTYDGGDQVVTTAIRLAGSSSSGTNVNNNNNLWEYQDDNGFWQAFRGDHQSMIENVYQQYNTQQRPSTSVEIKAGNWRYLVDIIALTQTNIEHKNRKQRTIRRNLEGIWEYCNDNNTWEAYDEHNQKLLEDTYQKLLMPPPSPTVQIQTDQWRYEINLQTMMQTNIEHVSRKQRPIRRQGGIDAAVAGGARAATGATTAIWEFLGDSGWEAYNSLHQEALENAYQRQLGGSGAALKQINLKINQSLYAVDLVAMTQTNLTHLNHKTRSVQRRIAPAAPMPVITPWKLPSYGGMFIPARPKSRVRNVNSNERMDNFIFGRGSIGDGFYSIETIDAYKILYLRLCKRAAYARSQVDWYDCTHCLCLGCTPTSANIREKAELESQWEELEYMKAFVAARLNGPGPDWNPEMSKIQQHLSRPITDRYRNDTSYAGGCGGYYPYFFYTGNYCADAGGCGGGTGGCGAGCGGGACGGGGCG